MSHLSFYSSLFLLTVLLGTTPALATGERFVSRGSITVVSGGVGDDSAERMAALGKGFNLKLLFAAKDGHYLAGIAVTITDARGASVIEAVSEGPFLFAKLAPGKYQVKATHEGQSLIRPTSIFMTGQRELIFRWDEAAD